MINLNIYLNILQEQYMLSETIHIKQEYCNECGVAAYATITGLTLQGSRKLWGKLRNNKGWITKGG